MSSLDHVLVPHAQLDDIGRTLQGLFLCGAFVYSRETDYPALREVLYPFWPDMPAAFPVIPAPFRATYSQEISDVTNLLRFEPRPDPAFRRELRERLPGLVSRQREKQVARASAPAGNGSSKWRGSLCQNRTVPGRCLCWNMGFGMGRINCCGK